MSVSKALVVVVAGFVGSAIGAFVTILLTILLGYGHVSYERMLPLIFIMMSAFALGAGFTVNAWWRRRDHESSRQSSRQSPR